MEINPEWQRAYRSELANNMSVKSNDFTKQLFLIDIIEECVWYSCDMCLEYYRQGPFKGFLPNTIDDISFNVCEAMSSMVPQFGDTQKNVVMSRVRNLLEDSSTYDELQERVNHYYSYLR